MKLMGNKMLKDVEWQHLLYECYFIANQKLEQGFSPCMAPFLKGKKVKYIRILFACFILSGSCIGKNHHGPGIFNAVTRKNTRKSIDQIAMSKLVINCVDLWLQ